MIEEADEGMEEKSQTIEENYRETVELVKKYIRVDVPSLAVNKESVLTANALEPEPLIIVSPPA